MALVIPLSQAYVFGRDGLEAKIAPPYDVISPQQREALQRHPQNITHLTLPGERTEDYEKAGILLEQWKRDGTLKPVSPCMLVYRQEFQLGGHAYATTSIIAMARVEPYGNMVILPHEETIPHHKQDRKLLAQATRWANLEPIFGLYSPETAIREMLSKDRGTPYIDVTSSVINDGTRHSLWKLEDEEQQAVTELFRSKQVIILDGHHRYETRMERNVQDCIMICLAASDDPGLKILRTVRVIGREAARAITRSTIEEYFTIYESGPGTLEKELARCGGDPCPSTCIGMLINDEAYVLSPKPAMHELVSGRPLIARDLAEIDAFLGKSRVPKEEITYKGIAGLDEVLGQCALTPAHAITPEALLRHIADGGGRLPRKTTYLYPKKWDGLVVAA